jgi:hypothetical protein
MAVLHFDFVLAIDSGNTFEVGDQVGCGENRINADDMNELTADLSSSQAPDRPQFDPRFRLAVRTNWMPFYSGCTYRPTY